MKLYSQQNKYAQNNLLAAFNTILRSPLELSGTYGSKFMLKTIKDNYLVVYHLINFTVELPNLIFFSMVKDLIKVKDHHGYHKG